MQGLTIQCPHCLHLVQVASGYLENNTICLNCIACKAIINLPLKEKAHTKPSNAHKPKNVVLPQEPIIPHISASDLQALDPEDHIEPPRSSNPLPEHLAAQIANIHPGRPGSTGIKNAFCRLWEEHWEDSGAHENFLQKANLQNALPIAGQLYGAVLQKFPDDKQAGAAREKILNLGLVQLGHMRGGESITTRKITTKKALWGVGLVVGLTLLTLIFSTLSQVINNSPGLTK